MASEPTNPPNGSPVPADEDAEFARVLAELQKEEKPRGLPMVPVFFPEMDTMDKDDSPAPNFMLTDDVPTPDELILTIRNKLGVTADKWEVQKNRSIKKLGSMPWAALGIRTMAMTMFESVEQAQKALKTAATMMEADSKYITNEDRNKAGQMMAAVLKSIQQLTAQAVQCLEKGIDPSAPENQPKAPKPKARPPKFGNTTQVYAAPGSNVTVASPEASKPVNDSPPR